MEFWNYAENINEYNNGIIKYQSGIQSNEFDIEKLYENSLKDKGVIITKYQNLIQEGVR